MCNRALNGALNDGRTGMSSANTRRPSAANEAWVGAAIDSRGGVRPKHGGSQLITRSGTGSRRRGLYLSVCTRKIMMTRGPWEAFLINSRGYVPANSVLGSRDSVAIS